ncbi:subtilisin-like protease SBT5.3 [Iris pallida]|uniref:Subtilisin-like protease SBT5.3 n=1 Tax=Iris pallida TaxID=29817 RepID=A0AAX6FLJ1_IRIPA|nr:subtilisin-like protease SBT5.3 [Iris pallida]
MGEHSHPSSDIAISANQAMLASVTGSEDEAANVAIHHYSKSFRGFSAMLTPEQASKLQESDEVISVFESKMSELHSTHSWDFLGVKLPSKYGREVAFQSDVIVGSIDTGIWPESKSFGDEHLGSVPERFKGKCVTGQNFTQAHCNRKIIGARYYSKGFEVNTPFESVGLPFFRSARDADGHGTHTASTIVGSITPNASLFGLASGRARGGAVGARLAVYKACWFGYCSDADVLAAFDDAIADGVDIISISAGNNPPQPSIFQDVFSIGSFHAFRKGVVVSASAGNDGRPGSAVNVFPWIITVAASSIDRKFNSYVFLGNSQILRGTSLNPTGLHRSYPIIYGSSAAAHGVPKLNASYCQRNTLDHKRAAGKIVVCTIEFFQRRQKGKGRSSKASWWRRNGPCRSEPR